MGRRLLERRQLPNGLLLEFWDESRKLAGDRWHLAVRAVVPTPLSEHPVEGIPSTVMEFILREVGDHLCFQLKEERNFIVETEVAALREEGRCHCPGPFAGLPSGRCFSRSEIARARQPLVPVTADSGLSRIAALPPGSCHSTSTVAERVPVHEANL